MKNLYSLLVCVLLAVVLLQYRISHSGIQSNVPLQVTTWDALGYYMYLPATFIYNDISKLECFLEIDRQYQLSGGDFYQGRKIETGNYVFKYLGGVAIMQTPFSV
jgi:hypothetical protein